MVALYTANTIFNDNSTHINHFQSLKVLLEESITVLPFIGGSYAKKLERLGIFTVKDLLYFFPRVYEDVRLVTNIDDAVEFDKKYTILGTVSSIQNTRTRSRRLTIQKATVSDDSGFINITWFNQPFLVNTLKEGMTAYFTGKLNPKKLLPEFSSPTYDIVNSDQINSARIVPVYPLTGGISGKWLRRRIFELISLLGSINNLKEYLPPDIISKYGLLDIKDALKIIHFPENRDSLINSRKRLAFDELLDIQLRLIKQKEAIESIRVRPNKSISLKRLPLLEKTGFDLTPSQIEAVNDINSDLTSGKLMHRLIQGDVGSGKTIVAFIACMSTIESNKQALFLAPTSVLAEQHYNLALKLFPKKIRIGLITSETAKKKSVLREKYDLVIGTHAILFHKPELLHNTGLLVVDEEHRFGVKQRESINGDIHYLSLTATPIPRSIALSLFGNLDVSIIHKPIGRKIVKTHIVPEAKRPDSLKWIQKLIQEGNQVFWVCPLIEDNIDLEAQSVKSLYEKLTAFFPKNRMRMLYGKMKPNEKTVTLTDFKNGDFSILISTTVIEVGIDIPQANLIIIENAERFGLAELHQLRGRVGRNNQEAWCLLYSNTHDALSIKRLQYFNTESDGNKLAEFDLQNRGPGEVYGHIQSGIPNLKIARFSNSDLLLQTHEAALQLYNL